jgi:hypothetical protein
MRAQGRRKARKSRQVRAVASGALHPATALGTTALRAFLN